MDKNKIRLYINHPLSIGAQIVLDAMQSHYIANVMRQKQGVLLKIFNGRDGEFLARLEQVHKKSTTIQIIESIRPFAASLPLHLYFAPVKKQGTDMIVEKTTELGVQSLSPFISDHSETRRINGERWQQIMIEAAEQSERLDLPCLNAEDDNLPKLDVLLQQQTRPTLIAVERAALAEKSDKTVQPLLSVLNRLEKEISAQGVTLVIGPEGGFSKDEIARWATVPHIYFISLGSQILRAETACIAGLATIAQFLNVKA